MLEEAGYEVEDLLLTSRDEVDALEAELKVATTPQIFIGGERIGGSEELASFLRTVGA
jgi:glutaredoxin